MAKEYIEREAFLADKKWLYCTDCDKRKGKKRGKMVTLYEIGEAPCKSCGINDMLEEVEAYPAADVREVKMAEWLTGNGNPRSYGRIRAMCGRCGAFALYEMVNAGSYKEQLSKFCPACGAEMRETPKEG